MARRSPLPLAAPRSSCHSLEVGRVPQRFASRRALARRGRWPARHLVGEVVRCREVMYSSPQPRPAAWQCLGFCARWITRDRWLDPSRVRTRQAAGSHIACALPRSLRVRAVARVSVSAIAASPSPGRLSAAHTSIAYRWVRMGSRAGRFPRPATHRSPAPPARVQGTRHSARVFTRPRRCDVPALGPSPPRFAVKRFLGTLFHNLANSSGTTKKSISRRSRNCPRPRPNRRRPASD